MSYALVIMCGGQSSRMGSNKASLPFGKGTLLEYQITRFRKFFPRIYISEAISAPGDEIPDVLFGCPVIRDLHENVGPLGGLYSCFCHTEEDILFFIPVDAPFINAAYAREMAELLTQNPEYNIVTIANKDGMLQPLYSAYRRTCLPHIEKLLEEKIFKLQYFLRHEQTMIPDRIFPEEQFFNMNHPQEYYQALMRYARQNPAEFPASFTAVSPGEQAAAIPVISFPARSGTGKTTFLERLLPHLTENGIRVAVIKHDAHGFEIDKPGKDSYRLSQAGAGHMILSSEDQTAVIIKHPKESQELDFLLSHIRNVDLIITEGYKFGSLPKIPLLRKGYCEEPAGNLDHIVAYVADFPYDTDLPVFPLNQPEALVPFLIETLHLKNQQS